MARHWNCIRVNSKGQLSLDHLKKSWVSLDTRYSLTRLRLNFENSTDNCKIGVLFGTCVKIESHQTHEELRHIFKAMAISLSWNHISRYRLWPYIPWHSASWDPPIFLLVSGTFIIPSIKRKIYLLPVCDDEFRSRKICPFLSTLAVGASEQWFFCPSLPQKAADNDWSLSFMETNTNSELEGTYLLWLVLKPWPRWRLGDHHHQAQIHAK